MPKEPGSDGARFGDDQVGEDVGRLAGVLPGLGVVPIPGRDHLSLVGEPRLTRAILRFLDRQPRR